MELKEDIEAILSVMDDLISDMQLLDIYSGNEKTERLEQLQDMKQKLEMYHRKIQNNEIEIVFIGKEKVGKSTFVNAFIGKNILPVSVERATYTPTQIKYDPHGRVEVVFYSEDEFLNKVFRPLLKDIEYPNAESQTLTTVSVQDIKHHFDHLRINNKLLYNEHSGKTENDILDMINGSQEIRQYLNKGNMNFKEEDIEAYKKFIVDRYTSRAVKEITIYMKELKGLENAVICDVPGFDSPTFKHSEFTINKVKQADAVVMLRDRNPSITGPELDIINETRDEDGVELKEKLFFFVNGVDMIHTREKLDEIIEKFKKDLELNRLYKEGRVFYGSALAYLYEIGQDTDNNAKEAYNRIKDLGINPSIKELYNSIVSYNQTERRDVLRKRINMFKNEVEKFLKEIIAVLQDKAISSNLRKQSNEQILSLKRKSTEYIDRNLNIIIDSLKKKLKEKVISNRLQYHMDQNIGMLSEDELEQIRLSIESLSSSSEAQPDKFNIRVRETIRERIRKNFNTSLKTILREESDQFKSQVIDIFVKGLEPSGDIEKVKELVEAFLNKNLPAVYQESSLELIVDRFSGHIIELMTIPLTSVDRFNKFKEVQRDIYSVLVFDKDFDLNIPPIKQKIVYTILYQDYSLEEAKSKVKDILKELKFSDEDINDIINNIVETAVPYGAIIKRLMNLKVDKDSNIRKGNIISMINNIDSDKDFHNDFVKDLRPPQNYDEVKREIENDLKNLKDILKKCVINAIDPESAFIINVTKYVSIIRDLINSKEYDEFINDNNEVIKKSESEQIIRQETQNQIIKSEIKKIESLLNKLNKGGK